MWAILFPFYGGDGVAFLTRWVTHLAAPGFFFLMGAGMVFFTRSRRSQGWSSRRIALHFAIRGLLLIALQFTLENFVWSLGGMVDQVYFGVLYALGGGLILGTLFLRLNSRSAALIGLGWKNFCICLDLFQNDLEAHVEHRPSCTHFHSEQPPHVLLHLPKALRQR